MPSPRHELLVQVLREHPQVVVELLRAHGDDAQSSTYEVIPAPASVSELEPAEFRADLVLRRSAPGDPRGGDALVVEVQLGIDPDKRFTWVLYVAGLRSRLRCPVDLVVLTLDDVVARWAAAPIAIDTRGSVLLPRVLGPADVPIISDPAAARTLPELAVVSVLAHANEASGALVGRALLQACRDLDDARGRLYTDVVFAFLNDAARRALEADMQLDKYEYQSEFARRFLAQGREEGREAGHVEALGAAILAVLEARGLAIDEHVRARIIACRDPEQLRAWVAAAATVGASSALFG
jgi:hypothetical protein